MEEWPGRRVGRGGIFGASPEDDDSVLDLAERAGRGGTEGTVLADITESFRKVNSTELTEGERGGLSRVCYQYY